MTDAEAEEASMAQVIGSIQSFAELDGAYTEATRRGMAAIERVMFVRRRLELERRSRPRPWQALVRPDG